MLPYNFGQIVKVDFFYYCPSFQVLSHMKESWLVIRSFCEHEGVFKPLEIQGRTNFPP
jgi:hypothetical protein